MAYTGRYPQDAGDGKVVDVVASRERGRAGLAEPTKTSNDQARVVLQQNIWAQAELFEHAWTEWIQQDICFLQKLANRGDCSRIFEVERDGAFVPEAKREIRHAFLCRLFALFFLPCEDVGAHGLGAVDTDHIGAKVGEDHASIGCGSKTAHLENSQA